MQIKINGQSESFHGPISLYALLECKVLKIENCVVLRNGNVIEKKDFLTTLIIENDDLILLSFVGGG